LHIVPNVKQKAVAGKNLYPVVFPVTDENAPFVVNRDTVWNNKAAFAGPRSTPGM
jgi:hypothetical protein